MDENKLSLGNFFKLVVEEQFYKRDPCSRESKGLSCLGNNHVSEKQRGLS